MGVLDAASTLFAPWTVEIDTIMPAAANNGWTVIQLDAACLYAGYKAVDSSVPTTNSITYYAMLAPGTWSLRTLYVKSAAAGILNVAVDGVTVGTIDAYAAATARNVLSTISGISVATAGRHTITVTIPTKNASSTGFAGFIQHMSLLRTA